MILHTDYIGLLSNTVQITRVSLLTAEKTANVWTTRDGGCRRRLAHYSGVWGDCAVFKLEDISAK